jgi:hypothetical protein
VELLRKALINYSKKYHNSTVEKITEFVANSNKKIPGYERIGYPRTLEKAKELYKCGQL